MKKIILFLILMLSSFTSYANPVPVLSYPIIGRGVMDRKTNESIAIACIDEQAIAEDFDLGNCTKIQHLYIDVNGVSQLIGKVYTIGNGGIKKKLKKINSEFLLARRYAAKLNKTGLHTMVEGALYFGSGFLFPTLMLPILLSPVGAGAFFSIILVEYYFSTQNAFKFQSSKQSKVYLDQNGWNWAEDPQKTNHKKFQSYLEFIKTGNPGKVFLG